MNRSAPVPAALLALSAIPLVAGTLRLLQLAGGPQLIPADDRFATLPLPLVLHIVGAAVYAVVGAFQFVPRIRRNHRAWHRRAGRVLTVAGLVVAASAVWMTIAYAPKAGTGDLLYLLRLTFGSALAACLVLGFAAVRRRDIAAHRAWMIRAYAIALAAGTQAVTEGIGGALFGTGEIRGDLAKGAGWVINLAVAEWAIRRQPSHRTGRTLMKTYEFRVEGHLDDHWSPLLGDLALAHHADGTSTLTGTVVDQAQLHGILARLRDIGATLLSLRTLEPSPAPE